MQDLRVNAPLKHKHMPVLKEGDLLGSLSEVQRAAPSGGKKRRKAGDNIRILQFSDIHLDYLYKEVCSLTC